MSEMIERLAKTMREHMYVYQIGGELHGDLYVSRAGEVLAGPFKTMEAAELGRDCVIVRAVLQELRDNPTAEMANHAALTVKGDLSVDGMCAFGRPYPETATAVLRAMLDKALEE